MVLRAPEDRLADRGRRVVQRGCGLAHRVAGQDLRVVGRGRHDVVAHVDEGDELRVVLLRQPPLERRGRLERLVEAPFHLIRRELDGVEGEVVAGVGRLVERERRRVRVDIHARGVGRAEVVERSESGERRHHRPALGGAQRAVLGADIHDQELAVPRERRARIRASAARRPAGIRWCRSRPAGTVVTFCTTAAGATAAGTGRSRGRIALNELGDHERGDDGQEPEDAADGHQQRAPRRRRAGLESLCPFALFCPALLAGLLVGHVAPYRSGAVKEYFGSVPPSGESAPATQYRTCAISMPRAIDTGTEMIRTNR